MSAWRFKSPMTYWMWPAIRSAVGKRVAKDADRGKLTFPRLLGMRPVGSKQLRLIDGACAMIEIFGPRAEPLRALAKFVLAAEELANN